MERTFQIEQKLPELHFTERAGTSLNSLQRKSAQKCTGNITFVPENLMD